MTIALNDGKVRVTLTGTEISTVGSSGVSSQVALPATIAGDSGAIAGVFSKNRANGTGNGQINAVASLTGTVTAGTPVNLDLKALVQGNRTLTLTGIKDLLIQEITGTTPNSANDLIVGDETGTLTNAFWAPWQTNSHADVISQASGRYYGDYFGFVVDNTHKVLQLKAAAGTVIYQIDILGTQ